MINYILSEIESINKHLYMIRHIFNNEEAFLVFFQLKQKQLLHFTLTVNNQRLARNICIKKRGELMRHHFMCHFVSISDVRLTPIPS